MLKGDFIKLYSEKYKIKEKTAEKEVERFLETLQTALFENQVINFRKFGSFEVKQTKERMVVDPKNQQEKILIHAKPRKYVKFKVSRMLEDKLYFEKEN